MQPRRIFASALSEVTTQDVTVDFGAFVERLLLADEYILHSRNLQEIPQLVQRFGVGPVTRLFAQDGISICVEKAHVGLIENTSAPMQPYLLHAAAVRLKQPDSSQCDLKLLDGWLNHIQTADRGRLIDSISEALLFADDDFQSSLNSDFNIAVQNKARIYPYLETVLAQLGAAKAGKAFAFSAEIGDTITRGQHQGTQLTIETDLERSYGLRPEFVGKAIRKAVLGLSGEVSRVNEMREYNAVSEFNEEDIPLFGEHIDFLQSRVLPDQAKENLHRTIEFANAPDFQDPQFLSKIDLDMLIEVRQSNEAQVFREWLWRVGEFDEEDIAKGVTQLSRPFWERLGGVLESRKGKTLRVLAASCASEAMSAAIGGPLGMAASLVPGLANAHLLNRFANAAGPPPPLAFVRDGYPSLFEPHPEKYATLRERRRKSLKRQRR